MQNTGVAFIRNELQMLAAQRRGALARERGTPGDARSELPGPPARIGTAPCTVRPPGTADRCSGGLFPMAQRFFAADSGITLLIGTVPAGSGGSQPQSGSSALVPVAAPASVPAARFDGLPRVR